MMWTSLLGIVTLVLLARALGFARAPLLADEAAARRIATDQLCDFDAAAAVLAGDGRAALVAAPGGEVALIRPLGDRWVVRRLAGASAQADGDRLRLTLPEAMFPAIELRLASPEIAAHWARAL